MRAAPEREGATLSTAAKVVLFTVGGTLVAVAVLAVAVVVLVQLLAGVAASSRDGNVLAQAAVRSTAAELTEELGYTRTGSDAESIAANEFLARSEPLRRLTPLTWSGDHGPGGSVVVDVLIHVDVPARSSSQVFGSSNSAGSAEGCYRFTLPIGDIARSASIACPDVAQPPPMPVATVPPSLPTDAEVRLAGVLASATPATLDGAALAAFPSPEVSVDTASTDEGELVAAVGVAASRDCVVLVRHTDSSIERIWFDRIQLEPGEGGCTVRLYTSPAL